jgi:hypothetical protein
VTSEIKLVTTENLDDFIENFVANSSIIITGIKGHGKSNLAKWIARELLKSRKTCTQIFDSSLAWFNNFDTIPFQFCADYIQFDSMMDANMLYSIEFEDSEDVNFIIKEIVRENYLNRRTMKIAEGMTNKLSNTLAETNHRASDFDKFYIGIVEEAQNVIGTYSLMSRTNRGWLKILSDCRNLNMSIIFVGQRLSDISAKAVERCNAYFIGKTTGDNDILKLRRILGSDNRHVIETIKTLDKGKFIFYDGEHVFLVDLPEFKPNGTPQLEMSQKKWFEFNRYSLQPENLSAEIRYWVQNMTKASKEVRAKC